ncbi:DUF4062 domain-containing protein [Actinomadura sp. NEAU-AAG7]|uniref:DUF4062 domain-containing protein n=1 Tax=Actinomadura sp. NEAU-AAG7 TaxID=2839640 RepID=UPI001BE434B6|nr:DUF4062 domain-containing protein [Actinomadura sp. NEAU-AAG7]MBT2213779.1 DUF4062 domain-containing protein [Actinomadura sp. NEAU-AAG7]
MENVRELVVFIASPGDLTGEREAVRRAADNLNTTFASQFSMRLHVTGWEQTSPAFGRPQEVINPLVKQCDIFIGLLNRTWGTSTGKFSSGFEEEYECATQRAKKSNGPSIAIYFKKVPEDIVRDAGPSLSQVLKFRRRLENQKIALYRQFSTIEDFELKITHYFLSLIAEKSQSITPTAPKGTVDKTTSTELPSTQHTPQNNDEARMQIASTLNDFYKIAQGDEETASRPDPDRLLLFSMAAQREMLSIPIHPLNRIYGKRDKYVLSVAEYRLLVWTLAENFRFEEDGSIRSLAPGFKMIIDAGSDRDLESTLVYHVIDPEAEFSVANGSLRILRAMKARPSELWIETGNVDDRSLLSLASSQALDAAIDNWVQILETPLLETEALEYISSVIRDSDYLLFRAVSDRLGEQLVAQDILTLVAYAKGSLSEVADMAAQRFIAEGSCYERIVSASLAQMETKQLSSILQGRNLPNKLLSEAFRTLSSRRTPSVEEFGKLVKSENSDLVGQAFDAVDQGGDQAKLNLLAAVAEFKDDKHLGEYNDRLRAFIKTEEELRAELTLPWTYGQAWSALSWLHGSTMADEAREILDTNCGFLDPKMLEEAGWSRSIQNYLRSSARKSALSLLARVPAKDRSSEDAERARVELARNDWLTMLDAAKVLSKTGSFEDTETLLSCAANSYGDEEKLLLNLTVELGGLKIARMMVTAESEEAASVGALALACDNSVPLSELKGYLYSPHGSVRMEVWKAVERRMGRAELERYLEDYRSRTEGYYYDVVAALDRKLYMPS